MLTVRICVAETLSELRAKFCASKTRIKTHNSYAIDSDREKIALLLHLYLVCLCFFSMKCHFMPSYYNPVPWNSYVP